MWTDKNGAKVGVYGPNTKDLYTQTTDPHDEATFTQQGSCSGHFRNFTAILSKLHDQTVCVLIDVCVLDVLLKG